MGSLLYLREGVENSPYSHLLEPIYWQEICDVFTKDACCLMGLSVQSPLSVWSVLPSLLLLWWWDLCWLLFICCCCHFCCCCCCCLFVCFEGGGLCFLGFFFFLSLLEFICFEGGGLCFLGFFFFFSLLEFIAVAFSPLWQFRPARCSLRNASLILVWGMLVLRFHTMT